MLPLDETTAKLSTRGKRRSSSTQKSSSASKLFEEREEEEERTLEPPSSEASAVVEHPPEAAGVIKAPSTSEKLEHPAFPWSQGGGGGKSKPVSIDKEHRGGTFQSAPPSLQSSFAKGPDLPPTGKQSDGGPEISLQGGQLALFQEQLLQQQRQAQEQMLQALGGRLQSQEAPRARGSLSSAEEEGLRNELKAAQERARELEGDLGKKTEHTENQVGHCYTATVANPAVHTCTLFCVVSLSTVSNQNKEVS